MSKIDSLIAEFANNLRTAIAEEAALAFARVAGGDGREAGNGHRAKRGPKPKAAAPGKRVRRSAEDLEALGGTILAYIKKNPGQRAEQIGAALDLTSKDLVRPVALLLESKKLSKKGNRRATSYTAR